MHNGHSANKLMREWTDKHTDSHTNRWQLKQYLPRISLTTKIAVIPRLQLKWFGCQNTLTQESSYLKNDHVCYTVFQKDVVSNFCNTCNYQIKKLILLTEL